MKPGQVVATDSSLAQTRQNETRQRERRRYYENLVGKNVTTVYVELLPEEVLPPGGIYVSDNEAVKHVQEARFIRLQDEGVPPAEAHQLAEMVDPNRVVRLDRKNMADYFMNHADLLRQRSGIPALLSEQVEPYCSSLARLTFTEGNRYDESEPSEDALEDNHIDLVRKSKTLVRYGRNTDLVKEDIVTEILLAYGGILVLRSLTDQIDPSNGVPIKEARAWLIVRQYDAVGAFYTIERFMPDDVYSLLNPVDDDGNRQLSLTQVRYC